MNKDLDIKAGLDEDFNCKMRLDGKSDGKVIQGENLNSKAKLRLNYMFITTCVVVARVPEKTHGNQPINVELVDLNVEVENFYQLKINQKKLKI